MALSDILVCVDSTEAGEGRLKLAIRLARQHNAYLAGAYVLDGTSEPMFGQPRPLAAAGLAVGAWSTEAAAAGAMTPTETVPRSVARGEQAERRFREELRLRALDGDWHMIDGPDTAAVASLVKSFDLAILGQFFPDAHDAAGFHPDEIAPACGRPLLIVPYVGDFTTVGEHVLIAWDGTREATRALNDALPLIAAAKTATVMTILAQESQFERIAAPLQRIVGHLQRHGVPARAEQSLRGDLTVSDILLSRAADLGADLIVAGAYHHSQMREALIGGVSRDLLRHMTVPVLMSH